MNPVFLIGAERSGTTLLRLMLDAHPLISWLNEFEYAVDKVIHLDKWPDIEDYAKYLSTNRIFQSTGLTLNKSLSYPELIKSFLAQKQKRDNKPIIGATCHRHYDRLHRIFPHARFIHLLRDPRDVARSNIRMGWAGNVWYGIDRWITAENLWDNLKETLDENSYIEVKYENLITSPEGTLTAICRFLNIDYDGKMLSYEEHTTYSAPDVKLTEQWKRKMTSNEIALVESKIFDLMSSRGYPPHSAGGYEPSFVRKLFLRIHNRLFKIRIRIQRYGLGLTLFDFVGRKLGLKGLESKMKMKINEKTKQIIK